MTSLIGLVLKQKWSQIFAKRTTGVWGLAPSKLSHNELDRVGFKAKVVPNLREANHGGLGAGPQQIKTQRA
jgi:hypothetical protein